VKLGVDTSTNVLSIALEGSGLSANMEIRKKSAGSQQVAGIVEFLLQKLNKSASDIQEAYAGNGPGSFTGIRVALSFINTLSQTLRIPVASVSSLDLLAFGCGAWYTSVIPFIRSRRNEVFTAYYERGGRVTDYLVLDRDDFLTFIRERSPRTITAPDDELKDYAHLDLPGSFLASNPSARFIFSLADELKIEPEHGYLKPAYLRSF